MHEHLFVRYEMSMSLLPFSRYLRCSFTPIKAYKRGLGYPKEQFLVYGWYSEGWWIEHDPTSELGCTQEERITTLGYALGPVHAEFYTDLNLVTEGGLVSVVISVRINNNSCCGITCV